MYIMVYHMSYSMVYITCHIAWYICLSMPLLDSPNYSQPDTGRLDASVSQTVMLFEGYLILFFYEIHSPAGNTLSCKGCRRGFDSQCSQVGFEIFM